MQNLQTFIDLLTKGRNFHISILDVSGILNTSLTKISFRTVIHSKHFCDIAKSTPKGFRACLYCKKLANTKAIAGKEPFCGHCIYGLYEVSLPVVINGSVAAIIYVGNFVVDHTKTTTMIEKTCEKTGVNTEMLLTEMSACEVLDEPQEAFALAEIVRDYLVILSEKKSAPSSEHHWLVAQLKRHIEHSYATPISLKELAVTYHKNEKYLGRLFQREMGMSFHEYCNDVRLRKSADLLTSSTNKVIDIALECGYNNIAYFNRIFKKKYGMSPTDYRTTNYSKGD